MLDPQILTQAKIEATRVHLTVGNIIEEALEQYLKRQRKKTVETIYREHMEKTERQVESDSYNT
jgi:sensor histidine kinase regulating citrate/malate metabolism